MKSYQDSEAEFHTGVLLEAQRNQIPSKENFEMLLQETRAERAAGAIRELNRQLRSQQVEICHRDQEYDASRREHAELKAVRKLIEMLVLKTVQEVDEFERNLLLSLHCDATGTRSLLTLTVSTLSCRGEDWRTASRATPGGG